MGPVPRDVVEDWRDVSRTAAVATGFRARPRAVARASAVRSIGAVVVVALVVIGALAIRTPSPTRLAGAAVTATAEDTNFRLTLTTPHGSYATTDAIEPVASLTYLGPLPTTTVHHAMYPIGFRIEEVGGVRTMAGGMRQPCGSTELTKGIATDIPFAKAGSPDNPSDGFDQAWYEDPVLRLPEGSWRIIAYLDVQIGGDSCGGEPHKLTVENVIRVVSGEVATPSATSDGPVDATIDDGTFRLTLTTPHRMYAPTDAIEPVAAVTYLGPRPKETMYHGAYPVWFQIEEVGGKRVMGGGMDTPCLSTELTRSAPAEYPFGKAGAASDDPAAGFNSAWYQDPVLRLPEGTWRIIANLDIDTGKCGGEHHQLTVENVITVVVGANPSPAGQAAPSPTLSADAATALEIVRKYADAVGTDHPENAWPMLSTWSHRAAGSFGTYVDANRRFGPPAGAKYVVSQPSRDPDLLDPAFLGQRSADIALTADPSTVFVVSVTYPDAVGAALATQNLVAARLGGGEWRIWLDMSPDGYGVSYPDGCRFFDLSNRRCDAVMNAARTALGIDPATVEGIDLMPDQACGGSNRDPDSLDICVRTMAFVAGVRFHLADGTTLRHDVFCGPGPSTLVCSENPGIDAIDLHGAGYWDVPCTGEAPNGCPSPIPTPTGAAADVGRELRIATLDLPVGAKGHREVEIGRAVLVDGIVQEARFSIADQTQSGFLLDPGVVRMELGSTIAGRPPFDNAYRRGTFEGPEEVRVMLIFDVAETNPDAVIHISDVLVR
jgi:hypothetical protein